MPGEPLEGARDESGDRRSRFIAVDLGVGQSRVVVDDRMAVLPADLGAFLSAGAEPIAGQLVTGTAQARQPLGVDLQQITRARPLKATHRLARPAAGATCRAA